jgi:ABC-type glycerol-3-phosphate transport system substrate-binding protein
MRLSKLAATLTLALALALAACGGDGGEGNTETQPGVEAPATGTTSPSGPADFPPEFVDCMADHGIDIESSPDALHSPGAQEAFQACQQFLHSGAP